MCTTVERKLRQYIGLKGEGARREQGLSKGYEEGKKRGGKKSNRIE